MRLRLLASLLAFAVIAAMPAWAEVDQRCLGECISAGKPSSTCMPQCTFGTATPKQLHATGDNHKILDAPVPSSELILPSAPKKVSTSSKDYACVNQCLKDGWQYRLCEQRCMKKNCGAGSTQCKDLTGTAFSPFQQ